jgi:hypothetical protein
MRLFTRQTTQEVQLCPAGVGVSFHHNFVDAGRKKKECSFYANAIGGGPADGEIGIIAAFTRANDCALEFLDTFGVTFLDANMHTHLVTWFQLRDILILGRIKVFVQVNHLMYPHKIASPCGAGRDYNMRSGLEQVHKFEYNFPRCPRSSMDRVMDFESSG